MAVTPSSWIKPFSIQLSDVISRMLFSDRERANGTQLMATAMNRPLSTILFTPMAATGGGEAISGSMKEMTRQDSRR